MKNQTSFLIVILFITIIFGCEENDSNRTVAVGIEKPEMAQEDYVARGEYLLTIIGCDHCHTPKKMTDQGPVPDEDRWLMGHPADSPLPAIDKADVEPGKWVLFHGDLTAAVGPWGISYAANITPHDTGIGTWTYEQFKVAMTKGKHKGLENGRTILPPMPWQSLASLKEDDLRSIYEYLQTVPAIENVVPAVVPPNQL